MNEDLLPHSLNPTPDSNVSSPEANQKKFILSQDLLSTPFTSMTLPGVVSCSRSLAGTSQTMSQVFSVQQIKDIFLQEPRKREQQFIHKERINCNSTSSCSYPLVTESLNINISPSQVLNHSPDAVSNQNVVDEVSDLSGIISINSAGNPRITAHHESFQGSSINENSLLRGSISCENSLSDLTPSITPVNLIDTSADSLIFEKEVFSVDQTSQAPFSKESSIISKDDKESSQNFVNNVVTSNRLLSKLIQSYKPDTATTLPLRISEFTKIPNASLKPSVPSEINNIGKVSIGTSAISSTLAVSSSSHIMPLHENVIDFNSRSSISNPITISQNTLSGISCSVSSDTYSSNHSVSISNKLQQPLQQLDELNFSEHYEDRVQQSCNGVLNEQLLTKSINKRHDIQTTSCNLVNKDIRFSYTEPRSEPMLVSGEQLIQENSMSIAIETSNPLSFIQEQQILSHYENDIAADIKDNRSLRQVDVFLSDLHSSDDHDLLRGPLTNTIVPDMASSTTSPVVSETTLSTSIGNGSHLPELPPSPILANISPDFLVGGSSSAPKTSPSSQPSFLPSLSTTTENLALSFSSHFLENSNMSIDIGNLSEGDASLNVPSHSFSDSLDSSGGKRSLGNELTFTNALKNATEKSHYDKNPRCSSEADMVHSNFLSGAKHLTHMDNLAFKGNSVITTTTTTRTSPEIFKVPSQAKHTLNYEGFPSPSKQNSFSAKEIPLIKIDSSEPHPLQKMQSSKVAESLVEEVSCFKCQLCSYLSLDKKEINEHMKIKHENSLNEAIDSHLSNNSEEKISIKKELFPIKKRKKKESKKVSNKVLSTKKVKREATPQMKVEILPNKKGGFQKNIVLVNEEDAGEQTSSLDSQEMLENSTYRSSLMSMQSSNSSFRFRTEDNSYDTKLDLNVCDDNSINRKCSTMLPSSSGMSSSEDENDETSNHSVNKVSDTSVNKAVCQNGYKAQNKAGRPAASQTMGIGKFKKSHPKMPVTDETLGIKCGINGCGLRLKEEGNILYHRKCHVEAFLKCPECHSKYPHWSSLATHLWRTHLIDMELNKCPKCDFKSYSYTKLMNGHWKTHSNERPFLCDVCGKDFKTAKQLRSHKVLHGDKKEELKHHCDMCQRKFAEKRMLLLHLEAVHKKVKPYLCNYCGNSFASKSTLNLHIRKHTGEKPFACENCNYRTSDHNSMRRHKMKHTNDRPYSCPYCDYSSIQSSTFKVHLRRKHEIQAQKDGLIFSCSYCTFKTVKKDNYLAHVGTHHISSADEQKEAERQQQEINKSTFKNRSRKPQNQVPPKTTEAVRQLSSDRQHSVIASTSTVDQENFPLSTLKKNTQMYLQEKQSPIQFQQLNLHQQQQQQQQPQQQQQQQQQQQFQQLLPQQIIVAKAQLPTSLTEGGNDSNTRTILVTNGNSKNSHSLSQQPMFYVLGEFVPVPQMVNVDVNDSTSDVNSDNGNTILLQNNISSSRRVILNPISNDDHFAYTNAEEALIQSVSINDGIVQLTPEVVAMPVTTDLVPLSQSQSVPGMIYVATSNQVETSSSSKMNQNSSAFP